jgi:malate dehydrogenase (oxaloacetate-decarboxylating)(NADP+)
MSARGCLRLVRGQGGLRCRCAIPAGSPRRADVPAFTGPNNLYIFPAVGMAIYATNAKRVTDEMFIEAAYAVADQVTPEQLKLGMLFPPQSNILEVEVQTAARVAKVIFDAGLARVDRPPDMVAFIQQHVYKPEYATFV